MAPTLPVCLELNRAGLTTSSFLAYCVALDESPDPSEPEFLRL